jgi:predicted MFS family arabinose efflux permease
VVCGWQFAITVGITLSYLLGIWVNWRMLALLGNV